MSGILIAVSTAELSRYSDFWDSLIHLNAPAGMPMSILIGRSANIAGNRNSLTREFLASDHEWIFYADDDQVFLPDTLLKLWRHGLPIVSGVYSSREYPFLPHVYDQPGDQPGKVKRRLCSAEDTGLIPILAAGAGCLLVHRRVIDALEPPYWTLGQIDKDEWGDDIDFFNRVRAKGFQPYVDMNAAIGHKTQAILYPERTNKGWGCTISSGNHPIGHLPPPDLAKLTAELALAGQVEHK